jgi:hypothetical protein
MRRIVLGCFAIFALSALGSLQESHRERVREVEHKLRGWDRKVGAVRSRLLDRKTSAARRNEAQPVLRQIEVRLRVERDLLWNLRGAVDSDFEKLASRSDSTFRQIDRLYAKLPPALRGRTGTR